MPHLFYDLHTSDQSSVYPRQRCPHEHIKVWESPLGVVTIEQKNAAIQTLVIQSDRMPGNMVPDMYIIRYTEIWTYWLLCVCVRMEYLHIT